jgi:hypothetical protein
MTAAVHRFPRSAFAPEQREEILRTAQANVANRAQDQRDLADRLMRQPVEDRLAKWKREADEAEAAARREREQRERESRREQRQAQRAATEGWGTWIAGEIERRIAEHVKGQQDITRDLLRLIDTHNETFERAAESLAAMKAENTALRGELAKVRGEHAVAFERLTARIVKLEDDANNSVAATAVSMSAMSSVLKEIQAVPPVRYYLEARNGSGD